MELTQVTPLTISDSSTAISFNTTLIGSNKTEKEMLVNSHLNKIDKSVYIKIIFSLMVLLIGFCFSYFGDYEIFFNLYYFFRKK